MADELRTIEDFPEDIVAFLLDTAGFEFAKKFVKTHGISDEKVSDVLLFMQDAAFGNIALQDIPAELTKQLNVPSDKAKKAALEIAGKRLMPIEGVVGDVAGQIKKWGGDPKALSAGIPVVAPRKTKEEFVNDYVESPDVALDDAHLRHRLGLALTSFIKEEKNLKQIRDLLSRDIKVGGLELAPEAAQEVIAKFISAIAESGVLLEEEAKVEKKVAPEPKPPKVAPPSKAPVPKKKVESVKAPQVQATPPSPPLGRGGSRVELAPEPTPKPLPEPAPKADPGPVLTQKPAPIQMKPVVLAPDPIVKTVPKPTATPPSPPLARGGITEDAPPKTKLDAFDEDDEKEITEHKEKANEVVASAAGPLLDINEAIDRIVKASGLTFESPEMKARFEKAIESRLRDVRDAYETRNQLESSKEQGGLGIVGAQLAAVSSSIEKIVGEYHSSIAAKKEEEIRARQVQLKKERAARAKQREQKKQEELAKRYSKITRSVKAPAVPTAIADQMKTQEATIDTAKMKTAAKQTPAVTPRYSGATMHQTGKPKMQDVRFTRKLAGPVEELRSLDLTEFRRLSEFPNEAITKIKDKIDLLEDEGFDKKIAGIKAWRDSIINKMYLALVQEAFLQSKAITDILAEKHRAGEKTLNQAEVNAIIELNAELRF